MFILKCRRKVIYGALCQHFGEIFRDLAQQRKCKVVEGHLMKDRVHVCLSCISYSYDKSYLNNQITFNNRVKRRGAASHFPRR
ncbi:transposase [Undibacterium amnicola]|uniref:Transposase n=1 Tax=Undibacterium amnicola TaxID=1834038 RepID=A0ABR6XR89_9BURK|nr:transposase [Undibacterium amnicola]